MKRIFSFAVKKPPVANTISLVVPVETVATTKLPPYPAPPTALLNM